MGTINPVTGQNLPTDAIQRILFIYSGVNLYQIPPATSTKGYHATLWTQNPQDQVFTGRIRVIETAIPNHRQQSGEQITLDIVIEDPNTGELFVAVPYTSPGAVEQALDSARFFAVRAQGRDPRQKAVLGLGFQERGEAIDFSIALQQARKTLGWEKAPQSQSRSSKAPQQPPKDFSLKEGETITVNIGGMQNKGRRDRSQASGSGSGESSGGISLPPPPGSAFLAPPPSAEEVKAKKRSSQTFSEPVDTSTENNGFDDGEFGEFQ